MSRRDDIHYVLVAYNMNKKIWSVRCREDIYRNPNIEVINDTTVIMHGLVYTIVLSDVKRVAQTFAESLRLAYYGVSNYRKGYLQHRTKCQEVNTVQKDSIDF